MSFCAKSFHFNIFDKEGKQRCVTGFRANENQNSIKLALKNTGKKNEKQKILVIIYIQQSVEQTKLKKKKTSTKKSFSIEDEMK